MTTDAIINISETIHNYAVAYEDWVTKGKEGKPPLNPVVSIVMSFECREKEHKKTIFDLQLKINKVQKAIL